MAVVAPNRTNAVLNAPDGVDVTVANFDVMSDSIPEEVDATTAVFSLFVLNSFNPPPLGIEIRLAIQLLLVE